MKRIAFVCLLLLSLFAVAAFAEEMTGIITCEKCKHVDAGKLGCAKGCIKGGVAALFYDTNTQKFYKVKNQEAVKTHAGEKVVVTGTVSGDSLTVDSIKAAPAS